MRLSIRNKLGASFLVVFAMAGTTNLYALYTINRLNDDMAILVTRDFERVRLAERLNAEQLRMKSAIRDHMLSPPAGKAAEKAEVAAARANMRESFDSLVATSPEADLAALAEYEDLWTQSIRVNDKALLLSEEGRTEEARKLLWGDYFTRLQASRMEIMEGLRDRSLVALKATQAEAAEARRLTVLLMASSIAAGTLIAFLAAGWLILSIGRGLGRALALARRVADGDLTETAVLRGNDEITDLLRALNAMVVRLRDVVGRVTAAVGDVASGSAEVAATSEQLSQGASEQAAATVQASASVEEIAATVRQSAENSGQTERMARSSAEAARQSGAAVSDAVSAMRGIAERIHVVQGDRPPDGPSGAECRGRGGAGGRARAGLCRGGHGGPPAGGAEPGRRGRDLGSVLRHRALGGGRGRDDRKPRARHRADGRPCFRHFFGFARACGGCFTSEPGPSPARYGDAAEHGRGERAFGPGRGSVGTVGGSARGRQLLPHRRSRGAGAAQGRENDPDAEGLRCTA